MKKSILASFLVLVCSANIAYSASKPNNVGINQKKVPNSSTMQAVNQCDDAKADQLRQIENLPRTTGRLVECYGAGGDESSCETIFHTFECYYGYLKEASARVKQHCN